MTPTRRFLALSVLCLLAAPVTLAVDDPGEPDPRTIRSAIAEARPDAAVTGDPGLTALRQRYGGGWDLRVDRRTGLATLAQGSGVPLVPGRGNGLGAEALAGLPMPDGDVSVDTLEPLARAFLDANRALALPAGGVLELDRDTSSVRDDGRLVSLYFRWVIDGIPVERGRVFVRLNSGNVTQFGAPLIGGRAPGEPPAIDADTAIRTLLDWSGDAELARIDDDPRLVLQPEDGGAVLRYRPVFVVRYRTPGRIETWEGRVDAVTGEIVSFVDANRYGRVTGGIYPRTVIDEEVSVPMPYSTVTVDGAAQAADEAGAFPFSGGAIGSGLDGSFFTTNCSDGCSSPSQATAQIDLGAGFVDFGVGGLDAVGNGLSTPAERNAYYHMNQVRRVAKRWLPDLGWLGTNVTVNVNIANTCNATWSGSANFYRSGGGCNNTGEISDVMHHEWGHGLDGNTRSGDGATGEGTADVVAMHMTHSPQIGPYFRTTGAPVRDLDAATNARGLLTRGNIATKCPTGSGALGYQVHCEGEIIGQTTWELSQALTAKHGHHTGWRTSERLFFTSMPDQGSYLNDGSFPFYDAYLNADDDDGNLANGTPNAQEIFDAFDRHGIAGAPVATSAACTRPATVNVVATPGCDSIDLSWSAVPGIDRYLVVRAEVLLDGPFFPVADLAAGQTSFVDSTVAPGVDYWYSVIAVAGDGCESAIESPVASTLVPQPVLTASAVVVDDVPRGNRSGSPDPDEDVDLRVTLRNLGTEDAQAVDATLSAETPGVTILEGFDTWPAIQAGSGATSDATLRFTTDGAQVACGDRLRFRLDPNEGTGCAADASYFEVVLGDRTLEYGDDFEIDNGWTLDAGLSTATAGAWVYGDPDGTSYQPEDDATADPGRFAWFTGTNGGGLGTDDVDGGVTVLVSPTIDLSGLDEAILTYARWFGNRDLGEDPDDFFKADVSSDDGASWINLETLGSNDTAATWTRVEHDLAAIIPLTSQVRLRFQASDGTLDGNIIEAAIDDIRVEQAVCDDTPACFVEPDFAGVESVIAGASCGETTVTWQPASTNCQNATITYSVYRGTDAGFTPDASNRIAEGLTSTSFADSLLEPGIEYHYVVRAFDSRSGEDTNTVVGTVLSPVTPDLRAPLFDGVDLSASGNACGETTLSWTAAQETCNVPVSYEVYRSTDPGFVPSAATRVASTLSTSFTDAALVPGTVYTYVVRALDGAGNEDTNDVRVSVAATVLDATLLEEAFEPSPAGWSVVAPNDATTGNWEWGDPEGTDFQSPDDHSDPGANAWVTGLAAAGGGGGNDVDDGTTTLLSADYDLTGTVDPVVSYWRWFTNDLGGAPAEDPLVVEVDDGSGWTLLEQVDQAPLGWVRAEIPLAGIASPTATVRVRFTASDLGTGGSLVEAAIDDFAILDRDQGCLGCATPVGTVGTILLDRAGDDIVLDWTADPAPGTRFAVYRLEGAEFQDAVRIGTSDGRTFVHAGAATSGVSYSYRVTAIDACGNESGLK